VTSLADVACHVAGCGARAIYQRIEASDERRIRGVYYLQVGTGDV
jgi:hypothetical protein